MGAAEGGLPMRSARLAGCCDAMLAAKPEWKSPAHVPPLQIRAITAAHEGSMPPDVPSESGATVAPVPAQRLVCASSNSGG